MLTMQKPVIPKKYRPEGFDIIHEDMDLIAVNKSSGILSVEALWNDETVHSALNNYIRKGASRSSKEVYVVHRLDQYTSGVLLFAKSEKAQQDVKSNWRDSKKTYYCVVHGRLKNREGLIETYLSEDEDYLVHSSKTDTSGQLARTEYKVVHQAGLMSVVKINLLTGKKNQIRVHMAELGNPIAGDIKYGEKKSTFKNLMLHAYSLEIQHPFKKDRILFEAPLPAYFKNYKPDLPDTTPKTGYKVDQATGRKIENGAQTDDSGE